mgnify:CR=1 FL=1
MTRTQTNPRSLANLKKGVKITKKTAKENNRKSTIAKRQKKTMRETLELMLELFTDGEDDTRITYQDSILLSAIKKAQQGDIKAMEFIRDTIGQKPVIETKADIMTDGLPIKIDIVPVCAKKSKD